MVRVRCEEWAPPQCTVFSATCSRVCLPIGSPVFGLTSNRGNGGARGVEMMAVRPLASEAGQRQGTSWRFRTAEEGLS